MARPRPTESFQFPAKRATASSPLGVVLAVATLAIVARLAWLAGPWIVATADSPSFVSIAKGLRQATFADPRLGTVRLPGYPLFLALLDATMGLGASRIVVAQSVLGIGSAIAGAWLGLRLGSRAVALAMGLALALHPALIVFEHSLMSETLGVALAVAAAALLVSCARTGSLALAPLAGAVAAAALLTRLNSVPIVLVGALFALVGARRAVARGRPGAQRLRMAAALLAGFLALVLPWILHLGSVQGTWSLFPGGQKLRLANAIELGLISAEEVEAALGPVDPGAASPGSAYLKKLTLGPGTGEAEARAVLRRASERAPGAFARAAAVCSLAALGWLPPERLRAANELGAWLTTAERAGRGEPSLAYVRIGELLARPPGAWPAPPDSAFLRTAGGGGIALLRGALLAAGIVLSIVVFARRRSWSAEVALLVALGGVELLAALLFATSLAMRQRFAFPFDCVAFALPAAALAALGGSSVPEVAGGAAADRARETRA